jgi:glycosyltransferase involved in cell wall biosynthesis
MVLTLVVVNYNQGYLFEDCLRSICDQKLSDVELIVIDDKSPDNSVEQIESLLDRYKVTANFIKNEVNKGICGNLNLALSMARGKYFSFIAADDWVEKDCHINMIAALEAAADNVATVYGDCKVVNERKQLLYDSYIEHFRGDLKIPPQGDIFKDLLRGNFIPAHVTMSKTEILRKLGGFDENLKLEDYDMWLRVSRKYDFLYVQNAIGDYRILENSLIRTLGPRKFEDSINMFMKHIDADGEALEIIKRQVQKSCEFLFYTDSKKFRDFYETTKYFGVSKKLKVLSVLEMAGVKGSEFKKWSNKLMGRKVLVK